MSHKILFSYCFDDELERVYNCFKNFYIYTEITLSSILTKAKKIKGEFFDEEGAIMELILKNNYPIIVIVKNIHSSPLYHSFKHKLTYHEKNQMETYLECKFYWDSCEKKTIFFYEYYFNDELFSPFKNIMNENEFYTMCNNVQEYLKNNYEGLEISKGIFIHASIKKVWNFFNHWKNINEIILKKMKLISELKGNFETLNSIVNIYKADNNYLIASLKLKQISFSGNEKKLIFNNCDKNISMPNLSIEFCLNKTSEDTCFFDILFIPNQNINTEIKSLIIKYIIKGLISIKEYFKQKKKKDY